MSGRSLSPGHKAREDVSARGAKDLDFRLPAGLSVSCYTTQDGKRSTGVWHWEAGRRDDPEEIEYVARQTLLVLLYLKVSDSFSPTFAKLWSLNEGRVLPKGQKSRAFRRPQGGDSRLHFVIGRQTRPGIVADQRTHLGDDWPGCW